METLRVIINGTLCALGLWAFSTCIVAIQLLSVFIWPFSKLYYRFHSHMMRQWSQNLFQTMRFFAPGDLYITFDESCTRENVFEDNSVEEDDESEQDKLENLLTRNKQGQVIGVSFPEKLIMISNHQVSSNNDKKKACLFICFIGV
jgi:hypothetical protein